MKRKGKGELQKGNCVGALWRSAWQFSFPIQYLQTEKAEVVSAGQENITVEVKGDSLRPNVYRDTAVAEITYYEKNFDCESIVIKIGDETGKETRLTFEGGVWKGETGLGEGVLEVIPYIREDDDGESRKYWILDSEEGRPEHTENRTVKMRFRFPKEGSFTIREVSGRDLAGNISSLSEPVFVTVDRTPPEFQISLPEEKLNHEGYYSHPITVWLFLKEHNFNPEEKDNLPQVTLKTGEGDVAPVEKTENMWKMAPEKGKDWYKFPLNVGEDANYRLQVSYEDPAGWPLTEKSEKEKVFTVDMTEPEFGTITSMGESWNMLMEQITFGKYSSKAEPVVFEGRDSISPVEPLQYFCSEREMTKAELKALPEKYWQTGNTLLLVPDTKAVVYLKVTNYSGLSNYFSSSGFIVEDKGPVITLEPKGNRFPESGIYRGDVEIEVSLEEPKETGVVSGIKRAEYLLEAERGDGRELLRRETLMESDDSEGMNSDINERWQETIFLAAGDYDGEKLRLTVRAEDKAGNQSEKSVFLAIDVTAPKLEVIYGEEKPENGMYYNQERKVRLIVRESNFSEDHLWLFITNTEGDLPEISEWSHNGAVHSCQLTFFEDGDYTFSVKCEDLAGYVSETKPNSFTIDRTPPKISVVFSEEAKAQNGQYYASEREAEITIEEHNFWKDGVQDEIKALFDDGESGGLDVGEFDNRGDIHTARVVFRKDGDYHFQLGCADMAGNREKEHFEEKFSIDCTPPAIQVSGIENESANRGTVGAVAVWEDKRLRKESVKLEVLRLDRMVESRDYQYRELAGTAEKTVKELLSDSFPNREETDGLYLLKAFAADRAGNRAEKEVFFSVNRYGSVYEVAGESKKWLGTGEYPYLQKEQDVILREYNVDPVEDYHVAVNRNGMIFLLTEGKSFSREKVSTQGSDSGWMAYEYKINKEIFEPEGDYEILLYSEDKAGNKMGNVSAKNMERSVSFAFSIDKTGPSVLLSGAEDGGRYKTDKLRLFLDVRDNMFLQKVEIRTQGKKYCYEGAEIEQSFSQRGLEIVLSGADDWQALEIYAEDKAGNRLETGNGHGTGADGCLEWQFLVTSDWWIQLYRNPFKLFLVAVFAGGILAAGFIFIIYRRKKNQRWGTVGKRRHL